MDKVKNLGQVMTPIDIVNHMIDDVLHLSSEELKVYTFLDSGCGDGVFIQALLNRGVSADHIWACDIDEAFTPIINALLPTDHFRCGSFFQQKDWIGQFDIVIGNPPYVRIHNIPEEIKEEIRDFIFCVGMYDLYYAFYEFGLKCLKPNGILLYITPNSFIKNASGKVLRDYIENNNLLSYFEDFSDKQNFAGYSTYTCIVMLTSAYPTILVPWKQDREKVGLSYTSLQNGIATLADRIFISDNFDDMEKALVRPIIKASTGEMKWCIYPPETEEELAKYPRVYEYLLDFKKKLLNRAIKGNTKWFQFGRMQGLTNSNNEKIVIPTTISTSGMKTYRVDANTLVYSGLYATATDLDKLDEELHSDELMDYLAANGKPMRGGYVQITSTLLKNY